MSACFVGAEQIASEEQEEGADNAIKCPMLESGEWRWTMAGTWLWLCLGALLRLL